MRVARWYCPQGRMSFSLLPDCLCSRLRGSLDEAERVVVMSEAMGVEAAAQAIRVDEIELPGVLRWLGRRRRGVRAAVLALVTAMPGRLGTVAEVRAVRSVLGTERALVALREIGADRLHVLAPPVGFGPPRVRRRQCGGGVQHETGPDPPGAEA
jgi:hypothetical protein